MSEYELPWQIYDYSLKNEMLRLINDKGDWGTGEYQGKGRNSLGNLVKNYIFV